MSVIKRLKDARVKFAALCLQTLYGSICLSQRGLCKLSADLIPAFTFLAGPVMDHPYTPKCLSVTDSLLSDEVTPLVSWPSVEVSWMKPYISRHPQIETDESRGS